MQMSQSLRWKGVLAKCNYNIIMPEVRHRLVIPCTVFKYNYLSIKIKNLCYFSFSQLLILLPLIIWVIMTPVNLVTYSFSNVYKRQTVAATPKQYQFSFITIFNNFSCLQESWSSSKYHSCFKGIPAFDISVDAHWCQRYLYTLSRMWITFGMWIILNKCNFSGKKKCKLLISNDAQELYI